MNTARRFDTAEALARIARLPRPLVMTNGVFDILHRGHVAYLEAARALGANLVVAINSDDSVRRLGKGDGRPFNTLDDRMAVVAALRCVDLVVPFDEDTPRDLIVAAMPDILVKGSDWSHFVAGREEVEASGGRVVLLPLEPGYSTTATVEEVLSQQ